MSTYQCFSHQSANVSENDTTTHDQMESGSNVNCADLPQLSDHQFVDNEVDIEQWSQSDFAEQYTTTEDTAVSKNVETAGNQR